MNKGVKVSLIIAAVLVVFIGVPLIALWFISLDVSNSIKDIKDDFSTGYTDDDIKEYVQEEHDLEVEVIENEGRDPHSLKGLDIHDAVVETVDNDSVQFHVHISPRGRITSDDYEDEKRRKALNQTLKKSDIYQQVKQLGFTKVNIGNGDGSDFIVELETETAKRTNDDETIQMLYKAIPMLKEWMKEQKVNIDMAVLHKMKIDLQKTYNSWQELGNRLASENIEHFTFPFIEDDKDKVEEIEQELNDLDMEGSSLACYKMNVRDECAAYSFSLNKDLPEDEEHEREFEYDDSEDREDVFQAIELIKDVDLPIEKVLVERMYSPMDPEDQTYTEEELEDREVVTEFGTQEVTITNLDELSSADDIYYEYNY